LVNEEKALTRANYMSREPGKLVEAFEHWARIDAPSVGSPLYAELGHGVARDPELLRLAAETRPNQPAPNMLFAAVQYLLLGGKQHELRRHYPILGGGAEPQGRSMFPRFRDFCVAHRDEIVPLLKTRRTQTCVLRRCVCLLPAFARVFSEAPGPLSMLEVGPSAGLNLLWDRYRYDYGGEFHWGDPKSEVLLDTERRGDVPLPDLPEPIEVAWRTGIDLHPVDVGDDDQVRWLRALIFPEHLERHAQLSAAIRIARAQPLSIVEGDATDRLPALLDEAPRDSTLVVFATHALYQFPRDSLVQLLKSLQRHGEQRPLVFVSMEFTAVRHSELFLTRYRGGERSTIKLADCNPHGHWLEWLAA
jgi:hypothetical protein